MNRKSFTLANLANKCNVLMDRFRGLDFLSVIEPEEVGLDSKFVVHSSPSGDKYLKNLLTDLKIGSQDAIIDIGCGKGSAMRTMLEFPFAKVDGIELSDHIAAIARQNFKRLNAGRTTIFTGDATKFEGYDAYNLIYLYNPFPAIIMADVMKALFQSVQRSDRELVIIYNNATCNDLVVAGGIFEKMYAYPDKWDNLITIYSNRKYANSRLSLNKPVHHIPEKSIAAI